MDLDRLRFGMLKARMTFERATPSRRAAGQEINEPAGDRGSASQLPHWDWIDRRADPRLFCVEANRGREGPPARARYRHRGDRPGRNRPLCSSTASRSGSIRSSQCSRASSRWSGSHRNAHGRGVTDMSDSNAPPRRDVVPPRPDVDTPVHGDGRSLALVALSLVSIATLFVIPFLTVPCDRSDGLCGMGGPGWQRSLWSLAFLIGLGGFVIALIARRRTRFTRGKGIARTALIVAAVGTLLWLLPYCAEAGSGL